MKKIITAAIIAVMVMCLTGCDTSENIPTVETASAATTKAATKEEIEQPVITTNVTAKPAAQSKKKPAEKHYFCPECGQEVSEPDTLCDVCGESYYRLYGYGWVKCHVYGPEEIDWYMDNTLPCTCLPNEVCDSCRDKLNHGWKTSGESKYYEYSDFLKEKDLELIETSHPEQEQTTLSEPEPVKETKEEEEPPCEEDTTISNSVM